jgi:hypothetical protein
MSTFYGRADGEQIAHERQYGDRVERDGVSVGVLLRGVEFVDGVDVRLGFGVVLHGCIDNGLVLLCLKRGDLGRCRNRLELPEDVRLVLVRMCGGEIGREPGQERIRRGVSPFGESSSA